MSYKAPIAWHHGQFLQPQHFQLADIHVQAVISQLLPLAQRYFWGVSELDVDLAALERGQLVINQVQLFWQDGSCLDTRHNAIVVQRMLPIEMLREQKQLVVYLGLKRLDWAKANASYGTRDNVSEIKTRYLIDQDRPVVQDLYQEGPEAAVPQLHYVLKLFFQHEIQEIQAYDLVPLLKVVQTSSGITLADDFSPTMVQLAAYPVFWNKLKSIRSLLIDVYHFALAHKPNQEWYQLHVGESEIGKYLLAQTLHRLVPALLESVDQKCTHPFQLYQKLRDTIQEVSFYLSDKSRHDDYGYLYTLVPAYEHDQPAACLLAAVTCLQQLLEQILNGPQFRVALKRHDQYYTAALPKEFLSGNNRFYLIVQGKDAYRRDFMDHLIAAGKLTSAEAIDHAIQHAIPGVPLRYLPSRPTGAPDVPNALYFDIDCQHAQWAFIVQNASVGFYPGNSQEMLQVDLIAARGK